MALDALDTAEMPEQEPEAPQITPIQRLIQMAQMPNIVPALDEQTISELSHRVITEYKADDESRREWKDRIDEAMKLAMMVSEEKTYPFEKASNVKAPILAEAALQFNARAYPAIVPAEGLVKAKVSGRDQSGQKARRGERVSEYMSYDLQNRVTGWDEDMDRMLVRLPIVGCEIKKTWRDPAKGKCSRLVSAHRFVVNYWTQSLDNCPRHTEEIDLYPDEIETRIRSGRFIEFDYANAAPKEGKEGEGAADDEYRPHRFLEQHRLADLDGDGYPEPYAVTVHEATQTVVRIAANFEIEGITTRQDGTIVAIERAEHYTKYDFMPNPEGGFYGLGFGWLLKDLGETINSTINQMLDAGHLSNLQGGLISSSVGIREKSIRLKMGEWRVVQSNLPLNQAVMPIRYDGPNSVLFSLLGLLVEWSKDITATKDVLTGEGQGKNASPTTTLALIEQGLQVFTAIYKRLYRGLKHEFSLFARMCAEDDPQVYNAFLDDPEGMFDPAQDFNLADMDITPVADPNAVSKMQKLAKAQFLYEVSQTNPMVNQEEALRRVFEAANFEDVDKLITPPPEPSPEEQAFMAAMMQLEKEGKAAEVAEKFTAALKNIAQAEGEEEGQQLDFYNLMLRTLQAEVTAEERQMNGAGGIPGMEGQPADPMGAGAVAGPGGIDAGVPSGAVAQPGNVPPAGMGGGATGSGL